MSNSKDTLQRLLATPCHLVSRALQQAKGFILHPVALVPRYALSYQTLNQPNRFYGTTSGAAA